MNADEYYAKAQRTIDTLNKLSGSLCEWKLEYFCYREDYPEENRIDVSAYVNSTVWDKMLDIVDKFGFDTSETRENGIKFHVGDVILYMDSRANIPWREEEQ